MRPGRRLVYYPVLTAVEVVEATHIDGVLWVRACLLCWWGSTS